MSSYVTEQRKRILEILKNSSERLFTVEELAEMLSCEGISLSTVYRTINRLYSKGLVRRTAIDGSRKFAYQYIDDEHCTEHLHLSCTQCGKIFHLENDISSNLIKQIQQKNNFLIDNSKTLLRGICDRCK
ncbi:MAG TPA: transcriptional repressor [Clostridiales bacterium]|nr:transcriptional repressor [Clostridiales bacterium]